MAYLSSFNLDGLKKYQAYINYKTQDELSDINGFEQWSSPFIDEPHQKAFDMVSRYLYQNESVNNLDMENPIHQNLLHLGYILMSPEKNFSHLSFDEQMIMVNLLGCNIQNHNSHIDINLSFNSFFDYAVSIGVICAGGKINSSGILAGFLINNYLQNKNDALENEKIAGLSMDDLKTVFGKNLEHPECLDKIMASKLNLTEQCALELRLHKKMVDLNEALSQQAHTSETKAYLEAKSDELLQQSQEYLSFIIGQSPGDISSIDDIEKLVNDEEFIESLPTSQLEELKNQLNEVSNSFNELKISAKQVKEQTAPNKKKSTHENKLEPVLTTISKHAEIMTNLIIKFQHLSEQEDAQEADKQAYLKQINHFCAAIGLALNPQDFPKIDDNNILPMFDNINSTLSHAGYKSAIEVLKNTETAQKRLNAINNKLSVFKSKNKTIKGDINIHLKKIHQLGKKLDNIKNNTFGLHLKYAIAYIGEAVGISSPKLKIAVQCVMNILDVVAFKSSKKAIKNAKSYQDSISIHMDKVESLYHEYSLNDTFSKRYEEIKHEDLKFISENPDLVSPLCYLKTQYEFLGDLEKKIKDVNEKLELLNYIAQYKDPKKDVNKLGKRIKELNNKKQKSPEETRELESLNKISRLKRTDPDLWKNCDNEKKSCQCDLQQLLEEQKKIKNETAIYSSTFYLKETWHQKKLAYEGVDDVNNKEQVDKQLALHVYRTEVEKQYQEFQYIYAKQHQFVANTTNQLMVLAQNLGLTGSASGIRLAKSSYDIYAASLSLFHSCNKLKGVFTETLFTNAFKSGDLDLVAKLIDQSKLQKTIEDLLANNENGANNKLIDILRYFQNPNNFPKPDDFSIEYMAAALTCLQSASLKLIVENLSTLNIFDIISKYGALQLATEFIPPVLIALVSITVILQITNYLSPPKDPHLEAINQAASTILSQIQQGFQYIADNEKHHSIMLQGMLQINQNLLRAIDAKLNSMNTTPQSLPKKDKKAYLKNQGIVLSIKNNIQKRMDDLKLEFDKAINSPNQESNLYKAFNAISQIFNKSKIDNAHEYCQVDSISAAKYRTISLSHLYFTDLLAQKLGFRKAIVSPVLIIEAIEQLYQLSVKLKEKSLSTEQKSYYKKLIELIEYEAKTFNELTNFAENGTAISSILKETKKNIHTLTFRLSIQFNIIIKNKLALIYGEQGTLLLNDRENYNKYLIPITGVFDSYTFRNEDSKGHPVYLPHKQNFVGFKRMLLSKVFSEPLSFLLEKPKSNYLDVFSELAYPMRPINPWAPEHYQNILKKKITNITHDDINVLMNIFLCEKTHKSNKQYTAYLQFKSVDYASSDYLMAIEDKENKYSPFKMKVTYHVSFNYLFKMSYHIENVDIIVNGEIINNSKDQKIVLAKTPFNTLKSNKTRLNGMAKYEKKYNELMIDRLYEHQELIKSILRDPSSETNKNKSILYPHNKRDDLLPLVFNKQFISKLMKQYNEFKLLDIANKYGVGHYVLEYDFVKSYSKKNHYEFVLKIVFLHQASMHRYLVMDVSLALFDSFTVESFFLQCNSTGKPVGFSFVEFLDIAINGSPKSNTFVIGLPGHESLEKQYAPSDLKFPGLLALSDYWWDHFFTFDYKSYKPEVVKDIFKMAQPSDKRSIPKTCQFMFKPAGNNHKDPFKRLKVYASFDQLKQLISEELTQALNPLTIELMGYSCEHSPAKTFNDVAPAYENFSSYCLTYELLNGFLIMTYGLTYTQSKDVLMKLFKLYHPSTYMSYLNSYFKKLPDAKDFETKNSFSELNDKYGQIITDETTLKGILASYKKQNTPLLIANHLKKLTSMLNDFNENKDKTPSKNETSGTDDSKSYQKTQSFFSQKPKSVDLTKMTAEEMLDMISSNKHLPIKIDNITVQLTDSDIVNTLNYYLKDTAIVRLLANYSLFNNDSLMQQKAIHDLLKVIHRDLEYMKKNQVPLIIPLAFESPKPDNVDTATANIGHWMLMVISPGMNEQAAKVSIIDSMNHLKDDFKNMLEIYLTQGITSDIILSHTEYNNVSISDVLKELKAPFPDGVNIEIKNMTCQNDHFSCGYWVIYHALLSITKGIDFLEHKNNIDSSKMIYFISKMLIIAQQTPEKNYFCTV